METVERGRLFVITGPDQEVRTQVAAALANTLSRSVLVDGASVANMVVNGREDLPDPPESPAPETAIEQLLFRYVGTLALADAYRSIGFDAVLVDYILGDYLADFLEIAAPETVHLVVLHQGQLAASHESATDEDAALSAAAIQLGLWIDTSEHTTGDTVLEILRRQGEAGLDTSGLAEATG